jgi:hydrogenase maturation factor
VLPQEEGFLSVYTTVSTAPGFEDRPGAMVTAAVNNLVAGGAEPQSLTVQATLPVSYEEPQLKTDMKQIAQAAASYHMQVVCGHTEISDAVTRPWYHMTGIGRVEDTQCRAQEVLQPGQSLVMTKWIALAGTAALALRYEEELGKRFPLTLIDRAKEFEKLMSVAQEARAITHFGTCAMHDLSQGGIFGALWEMAERAGVGLEVDLKKIPVKQETVEICEYFDINPYNLYSAGALLTGTTQPEALIAELAAGGVHAAVIGRVTDGRDRIIRNGEDVRFLDRPQQEEWYRRSRKS